MTLRGAEYEISVGVQQGTGQENVQNIVNRAEDAMRRDKEAYYQQNGQERRMRSLNEKLDRLMQESRMQTSSSASLRQNTLRCTSSTLRRIPSAKS